MAPTYIEEPVSIIFGRLAGPGVAREIQVKLVMLEEGDQVLDPHAINVGAGSLHDVFRREDLK